MLLLAGTPSHAPGAHEFNAGILLLEKCLRQNSGVEPVVVRGGWPTDEAVFEGVRTLVFYMDGGARHPMIQQDRLSRIATLMAKGVGLVCLHYAVEVPNDQGGPQFLEWIGGYYERDYSTNPHNDVEVTRASPNHPVSRGWKSFRGNDEWYYRIRLRPGVTPILTTMLPKDAPNLETIAWAIERPGGGRGFGFTGGHNHRNWGLEDQRRMILNAILWTAGVEVPRQGARGQIAPEDLTRNLDDKPAKKR